MDIQKKYNIQAKKSLWQNFLEDEKILDTIVSSTQITQENIVEVWPWYGALTFKLLQQYPQSLSLIELDTDMVEILTDREKWENWGQYCKELHTINEDVLKVSDFWYDQYKLIANIPYYITSPILYHFFYDVDISPTEMLILMQKDVADKILKQYHNKKPKSSVLSLFIAKKAHTKRICDVSASCFSPRPKVESSVLHFELHDDYERIDDVKFITFIKPLFSEPRKKLISNFLKAWYQKDALERYFLKTWLDLRIRPEDLSIQEYIELYEIDFEKC